MTFGTGSPTAAGAATMPPQSPAAGLVALPSPFVSPPTESSRSDVSLTGDVAVPDATNDPRTVRYPQLSSPLMIVPAPIVKVTPARTVKPEQKVPRTTGMRFPDHGRVELTLTVSDCNTTPVKRSALPELPSSNARFRDAWSMEIGVAASVTVLPDTVGTPTGDDRCSPSPRCANTLFVTDTDAPDAFTAVAAYDTCT
jgi:hypothetical protein